MLALVRLVNILTAVSTGIDIVTKAYPYVSEKAKGLFKRRKED